MTTMAVEVGGGGASAGPVRGVGGRQSANRGHVWVGGPLQGNSVWAIVGGSCWAILGRLAGLA
jgi:hypothetical protein